MFIETIDKRYILNSKYITSVFRKDERYIAMLLNDDHMYEISEEDYKKLKLNNANIVHMGIYCIDGHQEESEE